MYQSWGEWEFSSPIQESIREFSLVMCRESIDSTITRQWQYLKNKNSDSCPDQSPVKVMDVSINVNCDIEEIVSSTIEAFESELIVNEENFKDKSTDCLSRIFTQIACNLTDSGFANFCRIASTWENVKVVKNFFDNVILQKLMEKEEATLSTIRAVSALGKSKPEPLSACIIKLLTNGTKKFTDVELLEQLFDVFPKNFQEDIIRAIIQKDNFSETDWHLLQVLSFKTSFSLQIIIMFMHVKCDEYANNQAFSRLLVHICKHLQSHEYKDVINNIIERNHSLLKHQAMKYMSSL